MPRLPLHPMSPADRLDEVRACMAHGSCGCALGAGRAMILPLTPYRTDCEAKERARPTPRPEKAPTTSPHRSRYRRTAQAQPGRAEGALAGILRRGAAGLRRGFLIRGLAHRLQELTYGGLNRPTRRGSMR